MSGDRAGELLALCPNCTVGTFRPTAFPAFVLPRTRISHDRVTGIVERFVLS